MQGLEGLYHQKLFSKAQGTVWKRIDHSSRLTKGNQCPTRKGRHVWSIQVGHHIVFSWSWEGGAAKVERERRACKEERTATQLCCINLNFEDLPIIFNGIATDAVADKPFDLHFTKDKILWSWAKVGFVPFTRSCLENRRVRKELVGQHNKDSALEDFKYRNKFLVDDLEGDGFNSGIFEPWFQQQLTFIGQQQRRMRRLKNC